MPTKSPRINITFEHATAALLATLARHEHKSMSSITKELVLEALERREDKVLSSIAETRDTNSTRTVKHVDVWK
jgi:hypothetical protein